MIGTAAETFQGKRRGRKSEMPANSRDGDGDQLAASSITVADHTLSCRNSAKCVALMQPYYFPYAGYFRYSRLWTLSSFSTVSNSGDVAASTERKFQDRTGRPNG